MREIARQVRCWTCKTQPVDKLQIAGTVKGDGPLIAVLDNGSNNLATLRYRLKDVKFDAIEKACKGGR